MSSLDRILPFLQPIEDLLRDPAVTEVMVNDGGRRVFVERGGSAGARARPHARSPESDGRDQEHRAGVRRRDLRACSRSSTPGSRTALASPRCSRRAPSTGRH